MAFTDLNFIKAKTISLGGTSLPLGFEFAGGPEILEPDGLIGSAEMPADYEVIGKLDNAFNLPARVTYPAGRAFVQSFFATSGGSGSGDFSGYTKWNIPATPNTVAVIVGLSAATIGLSDAWVEGLDLEATQSGPVEMTLVCLGKSRGTTASEPAAPTHAALARMADCTIKLASAEIKCNGLKLSIRKNLESDFNNKVERDVVGQSEFYEITGSVTVNVNATTWTYFNQYTTTAATAELTAIFASGSDGFGFELDAIRFRGDQLPSPPRDGLYKADLEFKAYLPTAAGAPTGVNGILGYTKGS